MSTRPLNARVRNLIEESAQVRRTCRLRSIPQSKNKPTQRVLSEDAPALAQRAQALTSTSKVRASNVAHGTFELAA